MRIPLARTAALWILGVATACGPPSSDPSTTPDPAGKTVVIGVDGLDYRMLDQQVDAGNLPNFARLYREGSVGTLDIVPTGLPPVSPRIWTTFVTGQTPEVHGVKSFVYTDASGVRRLFSSDRRKSAAAWEIASDLGARVGVVNWWATYPAEEVNGFVISDRYNVLWSQRMAKFFGGSKAERDLEKAVFPASLIASLSEVKSSGEYSVMTPETAQMIDREIFDLANAALREHSVDILLVYTRSLDELSHLHWGTHQPIAGETPTRDLIADYLQQYDTLLGDFFGHLGVEDRLMILSDHGFERNPEKGPSGIHASAETAVGVFLVSGAGVRKGVRLERASALDVLPTLLHMAGLPASKEMPGTVVVSAFEEERRTALPRVGKFVRRASNNDSEGTEVDDDIIERLKALGYMKDEVEQDRAISRER